MEHELDCTLPPDYRRFMLRYGPGVLDNSTHIWSLERAVSETRAMRRRFARNWQELWDNALDLLGPDDWQRLVFIGGSSDADRFAFLPGAVPRFVEVPRGHPSILMAGASFEDLLAYLDPRTRYLPQPRRIVRRGVLETTGGSPDKNPYIHSFMPAASASPSLPAMAHKHVQIENSAGQSIASLLESIAHQDHLTAFTGDVAGTEGALQIPSYEATLGVRPDSAVVHIDVPIERQESLWQWLAARFQERNVHAALWNELGDGYVEAIGCGRASPVVAKLTASFLGEYKGRIEPIEQPAGWFASFDDATSVRTHLLSSCFNGRPRRENLVVFHPAASYLLLQLEREIRARVMEADDTIFLRVIPLYAQLEPHPHSIEVEAIGTKGYYRQGRIENVARPRWIRIPYNEPAKQ